MSAWRHLSLLAWWLNKLLTSVTREDRISMSLVVPNQKDLEWKTEMNLIGVNWKITWNFLIKVAVFEHRNYRCFFPSDLAYCIC